MSTHLETKLRVLGGTVLLVTSAALFHVPMEPWGLTPNGTKLSPFTSPATDRRDEELLAIQGLWIAGSVGLISLSLMTLLVWLNRSCWVQRFSMLAGSVIAGLACEVSLFLWVHWKQRFDATLTNTWMVGVVAVIPLVAILVMGYPDLPMGRLTTEQELGIQADRPEGQV